MTFSKNKLFGLAFCFGLALITCPRIYAQVIVNPGGGSYITLGGAFNAINAGTHTGSITVEITGNTTEMVSAVLNASGVGAASYSSIVISPSGGMARTIAGNIAGHLVDLNGSDNVTIDGLNSESNSLTIINTSTSGSASTIRLVGDANNNTITRANIQGSTGAAASFGLGIINFSTGVTTGNDDNTVSFCNISAAGTNLPINCIFSQGTSTAVENSGNSILSNNIFDFFNTNASSYGVNVNSGSTSWTINGNSVYQTGTRSYLTGSLHAGIFVVTGTSHTINDNFVGGSAPNVGGTAYTMTGNVGSRFVGIQVSANTPTGINNIQGNTISHVNLTTTNNTNATSGILCGINAASGTFNIGTTTGNTIGSMTTADNFRGSSSAVIALVVAIHSSSFAAISIKNNLIGGLSSSGVTAGVGGNVTGVNVSGTATSLVISDNTIGSTVPQNMRGGTLGLTTNNSQVSGIQLFASPNIATITNNTIQNLAAYGTGTASFVRGIHTSTVAAPSASGWSISNNTVTNLETNSGFTAFGNGLVGALGIHHFPSQGCLISQNMISNISNINTTATTSIMVHGISHGNGNGTIITRNRIWGLSNMSIGTTTTSPPIVAGISLRTATGTVDIHNNMIALGAGQTTNTSFIGIWSNNGAAGNTNTINVYYNTVIIEGSAASGALPSFAVMRSQYISATANLQPMSIKNNIFQNTRTGGTGQHFAICNAYNATVSATGWPANASNHNVLNADMNTIGYWGSALTFANWKVSSASDIASATMVPLTFTSTSVADLHINLGLTSTFIESSGMPIAGLTTDFDAQSRPGPTSINGGGTAPDIGADEFDGVPLLTILNVTAFIEGYMTGTTMKPVLMNSGVAGATTLQCDTLTVQLRNMTSPFAVAHSYKGVVGTNGQLACSFPISVIGNTYFLAVQHRNALETWSKTPLTISTGSGYDFSTSNTQAYGDNMVEVTTGVWALYSGDIDNNTGDGVVDNIDYPFWETDFFGSAEGYFKSDLNGDGVTDNIDYPFWENNFFNSIEIERP
jgi:hypothetical protein